MTLSPSSSDFIWVKATEPVLDAEEDDLAVLALSVELDLVPHGLVETPEHSAPLIPQPVRRIGKFQVSICGTGEVLGPVARPRHVADSFSDRF